MRLWRFALSVLLLIGLGPLFAEDSVQISRASLGIITIGSTDYAIYRFDSIAPPQDLPSNFFIAKRAKPGPEAIWFAAFKRLGETKYCGVWPNLAEGDAIQDGAYTEFQKSLSELSWPRQVDLGAKFDSLRVAAKQQLNWTLNDGDSKGPGFFQRIYDDRFGVVSEILGECDAVPWEAFVQVLKIGQAPGSQSRLDEHSGPPMWREASVPPAKRAGRPSPVTDGPSDDTGPESGALPIPNAATEPTSDAYPGTPEPGSRQPSVRKEGLDQSSRSEPNASPLRRTLKAVEDPIAFLTIPFAAGWDSKSAFPGSVRDATDRIYSADWAPAVWCAADRNGFDSLGVIFVAVTIAGFALGGLAVWFGRGRITKLAARFLWSPAQDSIASVLRSYPFLGRLVNALGKVGVNLHDRAESAESFHDSERINQRGDLEAPRPASFSRVVDRLIQAMDERTERIIMAIESGPNLVSDFSDHCPRESPRLSSIAQREFDIRMGSADEAFDRRSVAEPGGHRGDADGLAEIVKRLAPMLNRAMVSTANIWDQRAVFAALTSRLRSWSTGGDGIRDALADQVEALDHLAAWLQSHDQSQRRVLNEPTKESLEALFADVKSLSDAYSHACVALLSLAQISSVVLARTEKVVTLSHERTVSVERNANASLVRLKSVVDALKRDNEGLVAQLKMLSLADKEVQERADVTRTKAIEDAVNATLALQSKLDAMTQSLSDSHGLVDSLRGENTELRNRLTRTMVAVDIMSSTILADLRDAGYLDDAGPSSAGIPSWEDLKGAFERSRADAEFRPELPRFVRALIRLRRYIERPEVQELPHFAAAGLPQVFDKVKSKSFQNLYATTNTSDALIGLWMEFLQRVFSSALLFESYWNGPNDSPESELCKHLKGVCEAATVVMRLYARMQPHELFLPVDQQWVESRKAWVRRCERREVTEQLELDASFRDHVYFESQRGSVYCDVAVWGLDRLSPNGETAGLEFLSELVCKQPGSPWRCLG